jgi:hypothetical protein
MNKNFKVAFSSAIASLVLSTGAIAGSIAVKVESDGKAVSKSKVELWSASANSKPREIDKGISDDQGYIELEYDSSEKDGFLYVRSSAGKVSGRDAPELELMAIVPEDKPDHVVLNEITTIGSVWPIAQQFDVQTGLQGARNGLLIGTGHVIHLANVTNGSFGTTALDKGNLTKSETVGRMNTLAALVSLCGANNHRGGCKEFLNFTKSATTLEALTKIARKPYQQPNNYFKLFETYYPYPTGKQRRDTNFLPYLNYAPEDFSLQVKLSGGGIYSAGRLMFDVNANLWSGQNWMPGSQSGLTKAIGGGVSRLAPDGKPLSPPLVGYNGQGIDGVGWGTTISEDKVWVGTFNGIVGVFDLNGKPLGPATIQGKTGMFQGLATAPNGDVWLCDNQLDQMVIFPNGDHTNGRVVAVPGLRGPFAVAVDNNNVIWVTNDASMTVTRFEAEKPESATQIKVGIAPRGLGIDSQGNVWVAANLTPGFPLPKIPPGTGIIEEFKISIANIQKHQKDIPRTGNITLISPSGKVIKSNLLDGEIYAGWGVSIDGNDMVFASNFLGTGFLQVCGVNAKACPDGVNTGELIHYYRSGIMEETTDTMVDDAGNVWIANNWNFIPALTDDNPDRRTATEGGGDGVTVVYGIAKPVRNPLIGQVRRP